MTYVRRKRSAKCYNGEEFERQVSVEPCICTEEDWECDFGYERDSSAGVTTTGSADGPCVKSDRFMVESEDPPEDCKGYYYVSRGYRRIAGDGCVSGVDHSPYAYSCPMFDLFSGSTIYNLLVLGVCLGIVNFIYQNKG